MAVNPATAGAAAIINAQLAQWGITDLGKDVLRLLTEGWEPSALMVQLEQTEAYRKRFAGNEERRKKGLRILPPAEYVATETQLKGVLRSFGLPPGFYDSNQDMQKFIANDMSPSELQERARIAQERWLSAPPEDKAAMRDYYGVNQDGDAIAMLLNPDQALPLVQRRALSAQLGGIAARQGLSVDRARAEELTGLGISPDQAQQGYGQVAEALGTDQAIAARFGQTLTQADEEDARLLGLASARRRVRDLQSAEAGLFSGRSAAGGGALSGSGAGSY